MTWGDSSSGEAFAELLRSRATCTVTPWSHGPIYRITAHWRVDNSEAYDVSDGSDAVAVVGQGVVSLEDALRYFDARLSGLAPTEAWQRLALPRLALRRRWRRRQQGLDYGTCSVCEHSWSSHLGMGDPSLEACDECLYEISHEEPGAPAIPCLAKGPQPPVG
jgi:hypothetical protein